jgi:voltage-gated potassium channel
MKSPSSQEQSKTAAPHAQVYSHLSLWDLILACLSIYVITAMLAEMVFHFDPEISTVLHIVDAGLCMVFMADFVRRLITAPSKLAYLKWGWIDLAASIPTLDALRWGRMVSLGRVFFLLRALRSGRAILRLIRHDPARAVIALTLLLTMMVMISSSLLILHFETAERSNIKSGYDAIWWTLTTMTTVGYGDHFPVTIKGRMIGGLVMVGGIALYATLTAFISAKIMEIYQAHERDEVDAIYEEVRSLRVEMRELREALRRHEKGALSPPSESGPDLSGNSG